MDGRLDFIVPIIQRSPCNGHYLKHNLIEQIFQFFLTHEDSHDYRALPSGMPVTSLWFPRDSQGCILAGNHYELSPERDSSRAVRLLTAGLNAQQLYGVSTSFPPSVISLRSSNYRGWFWLRLLIPTSMVLPTIDRAGRLEVGWVGLGRDRSDRPNLSPDSSNTVHPKGSFTVVRIQLPQSWEVEMSADRESWQDGDHKEDSEGVHGT
jgi:hypothetical protein